MEQICSLESVLRQRETSLQKLSAHLRSKDVHQSHLQASLDVPKGGLCLDHGSNSSRNRRNIVIKVMVEEIKAEKPTPSPVPFKHRNKAPTWLFIILVHPMTRSNSVRLDCLYYGSV